MHLQDCERMFCIGWRDPNDLATDIGTPKSELKNPDRQLWHSAILGLKGAYRVFESFEDKAAQKWQLAPVCPTAQSHNLAPEWSENPVYHATMFLPTFWFICIQQRKTVETYGYPSPPAITPVTKWIDKDEPSPFLRTHSIIFTSSFTLPRPLVYKLQ